MAGEWDVVDETPVRRKAAQAANEWDVVAEAPVAGLPPLGQPLSAASEDAVSDLIGIERRERSTPGDLSDLFLRGVVGLPQLASDVLQLPANVGDALARSVGMDPTQVPALYGARQVLGAIDDAADYLPEQMDAAGIGAPSVSGGQLVESFVPSADLTLGERAGNVGRFALEQSVRSSPDMAAAVVATPAYIAGRANQIAENRAANDNRTDPTLGDLGVAGVAAPIEALLERFTTMRLLPGGTTMATPGVLPALARIAKELGIQGSLGGIEELAPYLAENAGTELGATGQGALEAFTGGAVAEGALGGVAQAGKEAVSAIGPDGRRVRQDAPVEPRADTPPSPAINPAPALGDDAELDALLLRNLPPEVVEGVLGDPNPAPAAPTPTPAGEVPERASLPAQDLVAEIAARMRQSAQERAAQSADAPRARTVPPPSQEIAAPAAPTTPAAEDVQASAAERLPAAGADLGPIERDDVLALKSEIGWEQVGGRLIRGGEIGTIDMGASAGRPIGDAIGRTQWVGKAGQNGRESTFWRNRPVKLNEKQAETALDKWSRGEKLGKREQQFVDYAHDFARGYAEEQEVDRQEAAKYEAWLAEQLPEAQDEDNTAEANEVAGLVERARAAGFDAFDTAPFEFESGEEYATRLRAMLEPRDDDFDRIFGEDAQGDLRGGAESAQAPAAEGFALDAPAQAAAAQEVAPASAGLFGAPSARDFIDNATRRRDAERNGQAGAGRTDMLAGEGELFAGRRPEQARVDETPTRPPPEPRKTASWVLRERTTGRVVAETFDRKKVDALNTERYEAVPAAQHLAEVNDPSTLAYRVARGEATDAPLESTEPAFYSALAQSVETAKGAPKRGDAAAWKGWLDGAQRRGEFRQAERDWLGVDDWLAQQEGPVTREELAEFVRANEVQVQDVVLGGGESFPEGWEVERLPNGEWQVLDAEGEERGFGLTREEAVRNAQDDDARSDAVAGGAPKFSSYQLPGGENYRELLLTLPEPKVARGKDAEAVNERLMALVDQHGAIQDMPPDARAEAERLSSEYYRLVDAPEEQAFRSSHFDQPNILAHVRFNERTDADGKRVLFLEEIQSDWHQAGRKQGYQGEGRAITDAEFAEFQRLGRLTDTTTEQDARYAELRALNESNASNAVPDAPLKATDEWAMLAFKRMVRWAADNGFDSIGWTTGAQQAERYDLSKQVESVTANRMAPKADAWEVSVKDKDGKGHVIGVKSAAELPDVVGKDLAEKITTTGGGTFTGLDLKVGGEGMRAFYDSILPKAVNKWAKRFGGRVGQTRLSNETATRQRNEDLDLLRELEQDVGTASKTQGGETVHALDITPAMREAALQGQPLFDAEATELTDDDLTDDERRVLRRSSPAERNALATLRAESAREQGERDASLLRDAVRKAVGDSPVRVAYTRGMAGLKGLVNDSFIQQLEDRQRLRGTKMRTSGLYVTADQTIDGDPLVVLFTDVVSTPDLAAFTAAHEIAGHHGLRALLGDSLDKALSIAEQNPTVKAVADSMMRRRKMTPNKRLLAIEEALADLAAASRTGDYATIRERHGVEVPTAQRKTLAGAIARFIERVKALFSRRGASFTDAQVHDLLADAWRAGQGLNTRPVSEALESAEESADALESVDYTPEQSAEVRRTEAATTLPVDRGTSGWNYDKGVWEGRKGTLKRARATMQDKMTAWADVQQQIASQLGTVIPDAQNVHRLENLMHGRVSEAIDRIEREQVEPLVQAMKAAGVDLATFEEYLYARHAQERNAVIAGINPKMPDGGSGMTNAEAAAILARADRATLEPLARRVDAITKANRRRLLQNGLITQEAHDAMEAQYQFYVPLRGQSEARRQQQAEGSRGLDTRRAPVKQALGRGAGNRATNLLGEVVGDAQRGVILGEKARVGRAVMRIVLANPNPDLWTLEPVQVERALDANGEVYEKVVTDWSDPSIVAVRHKGKLYRVKFEQPELAQALNHVGVDRIDAVTRVAGAVNRYFSAVLTKYNPAFTGVNMTRDALFGLTGLAVEHGELAALDAALHYPQAARAAYRQARGKDGDSEWDRHAREFAEAGGKTGYVNMPSVEELQRKIGKGRFGGYSPEGAARAARAVADMVGDINDAVENALRLSAYVTLRKRGMTTEQAAEVAKNLTVNFNRKGFEGSRLNAWFLFYNAAMQGAHRAGKLFKQPKTYAYLGTLAAIQAVAALAALGYEDDDGEPLWNKIPDHVKRRNIVIVRPDGAFITIPMPYGFNVFPYAAGRVTGAIADGETRRTKRDDRAGKIAADITVAAIDGLFPVPITEGAFGLAPEIVGIPLSIQANRDDFGRPIRREDAYAKSDTPRASMGRPDTLEIFKLTATGLNRLGGGDALTPPDAAMLDVAPEDIEYLLAKLGGGTLKFVVDTATLGQKAAGTEYGEDVSIRDVPIINRFASRIDEQASQQALFYQRRDVIERALKRVRVEYNSVGPEEAERLLASLPELTGAKFRRRKRDGDNGPAGSIIEVNGNPQIVVGKSDSVFGAYKAAEDAMKDRNEGVEAGYRVTPAGILPTDASRRRDAMIRRENTVRQAAQDELTRMWTRDVVGVAE